MRDDIRNFPLAWRWTRPAHNLLPDTVLAELVPLDSAAANRLDERLRSSYADGGYSLNFDLFASVEVHDASEPSSTFLDSLGFHEEMPVLLSWDRETALRTTWGIFRKYWDDFCYPSSDDVSITPEDDAWMLYYCHADTFEFGRRKK